MIDHRTKMVIQSFCLGFFITAFVLVLFAMIFKPIEIKDQRFKVVDQYQDCDVVRYTDPSGAKYHYFLHCKSL